MSSASGQTPQGGQGYATGYPPAAGYEAESRAAGYPTHRAERPGAIAGSILAGILMITSGAVGFLYGLAMVTKAGFFTYHAGYYYHWSTHGWGWTNLIVGAVVFAAGVCVILGMVWARVVGVILATLSAVASFLTIPYYPVWSIIVIALDIFIIWALVARRTQRA